MADMDATSRDLSSTSILENLMHDLEVLAQQQKSAPTPSSIGSWLTYVDRNMPLMLVARTIPDDMKEDKIETSTLGGKIYKEFYNYLYKKFVKVHVALNGPNAINRVDPNAPDPKKEIYENEGAFCVDEEEGGREELEATTIQVDALGQMFKYLTKYIVKKSYTPFTFVKNTFNSFGFITPIEKHDQEESFNIIDVDPITALFTNVQRFFNSYEQVEKKDEETRLHNTLARTITKIDINKPGQTKPKTKPCVLKDPKNVWDEIMPYDPKLIISNLLVVGAWLIAFWTPIFPFLLSFPSRNGLGGVDGNNRRDEEHAYYDPYESQYAHGIHDDSQAPNHLRTHANYHYHNSKEAPNHDSPSNHAVIANQDHFPTQHAVAGAHNSIDAQEVSSYTHYNVHDIWHNDAI
ncbi:unnamed protein product [Meganyctiphanes norvegica]|uniref:Uncharacterized protein n=1 Tax=Meganyctiphanes norvegica TaxID=48144 RepID=A0AAV2QV19_MEGNR